MPSTTFGMIPTFGGCAVIRLSVGAFLTLRSIRSSSSTIRPLEATITDQLGLPGKCWIVASTGPLFLETLINSSPPMKYAKKQEWP
ncbi:hypothetical protein CR513_13950, partial [Mucuna pruriens]